jgi:hypothetical protein
LLRLSGGRDRRCLVDLDRTIHRAVDWLNQERQHHPSASFVNACLAIGAHPDDVRKVLRELVTIGAVTSWREKIPGLRGPGVSRYSMNPHVATKLPGKARDAAQAAHPPLRLVQPA